MVRDLAFPIELLAGETRREPDGLAMSSRNQYLSIEERARAPELHAMLGGLREAILAGTPRIAAEASAVERLARRGFEVDYVAVRRPDLTEPPDGEHGRRVALVAARLGRTRLIDNLEFDVG
jgi:pantoate--beta-alanine ligase